MSDNETNDGMVVDNEVGSETSTNELLQYVDRDVVIPLFDKKREGLQDALYCFFKNAKVIGSADYGEWSSHCIAVAYEIQTTAEPLIVVIEVKDG